MLILRGQCSHASNFIDPLRTEVIGYECAKHDAIDRYAVPFCHALRSINRTGVDVHASVFMISTGRQMKMMFIFSAILHIPLQCNRIFVAHHDIILFGFFLIKAQSINRYPKVLYCINVCIITHCSSLAGFCAST